LTRTLPILAKRHLPVLTDFALSNVLVALDYDGTLAPIAPTPEEAAARDRTRVLLTRVALEYPCVVLSGRSLDDLVARLDGIPVWYAFGNHGLEPAGGEEQQRLAREWVQHLRQKLPADLGVRIEDKKHSVTVHYRQAPDRQRAIDAIEAAVRSLSDARPLDGSEAMNLIPRDGPDKGIALQHARRLFACDRAIYVGDDTTDEDAFRSDSPDRLLSIRIEPSSDSHARYHLRTQSEIDAFLRKLLRLRAPRYEKPPARGTAH
jgi:trehalose 6-phosphate phosphatase